MVKQITAIELKDKIISAQNREFLLLDVREPFEFDLARIEDSILIPLNLLQERINELDVHQEIIVICHHGIRSQQASNYLLYKGFTKVLNLAGGIDAWACECDTEVLRY
jgi:rhodanese-related sulfurtransferase